MTGNNPISSLLLLILIGIAVYLLLDNKSVNNLKNKFNNLCSNTENFIDDSNMENFEDAKDTQKTNSDVVVPVASVKPEVASNISDDNNDFSFSYDTPTYRPVENAPTSVDVAPTGAPASASVYNFEPNDESMFEISGSSLSDAFLPPIPPGTTTDTLDFKKQNMDSYNAKDFLPKEINDEWFETDFSLAKYQLNDDKLINSDRYIIGINTVGESLKNASWDIRGTIPNPRAIISPWNNSTYEPDFNLKPLC